MTENSVDSSKEVDSGALTSVRNRERTLMCALLFQLCVAVIELTQTFLLQ